MRTHADRVATEDVSERIEETLAAHLDPSARGHYVANVTYSDVYLADGVWDRLSKDDGAWRKTERAALAIPGVARLLRSDRLILMGAGVKPGRYGGTSSPADIAPTFARAAAVAMPQVEGRALDEAFARQQP